MRIMMSITFICKILVKNQEMTIFASSDAKLERKL